MNPLGLQYICNCPSMTMPEEADTTDRSCVQLPRGDRSMHPSDACTSAIPPVEGQITAPSPHRNTPATHASHAPSHRPKWTWQTAKNSKIFLCLVNKFLKIFRNAMKFVNFFRDLSKSAKIAVQVSKGPGIFLGLLAIGKVYSDCKHLVDTQCQTPERVKTAFFMVVHLDSVINAIGTTCKTIAAAVATAPPIAIWTPFYCFISFAIGFISLGLSAHSMYQARKLSRKLQGPIAQCLDPRASNDSKIEGLKNVLDVIQQEGIVPLSRHLLLSEQGGKDLAKRIDALRHNIQAEQSAFTADEEKFIRILSGRVKLQLGMESSHLTISAIGCVVGGISLVTVPSAGEIVATAVCSTTGIVALVTWGIRTFFVNKNPFDDNSHCRAVAMVNALANGVAKLKQRLHILTLVKHTMPAIATENT